jgi:transaldolase
MRKWIFLISITGIYFLNPGVNDMSYRRVIEPSGIEVEPVSVQLARQSNVLVSYDDLDLSLIEFGKLKQLVEKYGVKKVTSNPSIFLNALKRGDFDKEIKMLARRYLQQGIDPEQIPAMIYNELYRRIVKLAAEVLLAYWEQDPNDYFVSIETNPTTANDFWATLQEARDLNRMAPNIDVKIAATPQGIEAVEEAIAQGVDVNVTLIFPGIRIFKKGEVPHKYEEYLDKAYVYTDIFTGEEYVVIAPQFMDVIQAVESGYRRYFDNYPGDYKNAPRVVLSVFLSRMDTSEGAVDEQLNELLQQGKISLDKLLDEFKEDPRGRAGRYAGQLCYAILENWYHNSEVFETLDKNGVTPPRLLYASTKAKKDYIDPLNYVEPFQSSPQGLQIINTMPALTFETLLKEGRISPGSIQEELDRAVEYILKLQGLKIDLEQIGLHLRDQGVEAFAQDYLDAIRYINSVLQQPQ